MPTTSPESCCCEGTPSLSLATYLSSHCDLRTGSYCYLAFASALFRFVRASVTTCSERWPLNPLSPFQRAAALTAHYGAYPTKGATNLERMRARSHLMSLHRTVRDSSWLSRVCLQKACRSTNIAFRIANHSGVAKREGNLSCRSRAENVTENNLVLSTPSVKFFPS